MRSWCDRAHKSTIPQSTELPAIDNYFSAISLIIELPINLLFQCSRTSVFSGTTGKSKWFFRPDKSSSGPFCSALSSDFCADKAAINDHILQVESGKNECGSEVGLPCSLTFNLYYLFINWIESGYTLELLKLTFLNLGSRRVSKAYTFIFSDLPNRLSRRDGTCKWERWGKHPYYEILMFNPD